jgi:hypothetical protein
MSDREVTPRHPEERALLGSRWFVAHPTVPRASIVAVLNADVIGRAGVPSLFFTTLLHPDYHMLRDEPERIDVAKLARVARWTYATGWLVSETPTRPTLDAGFRLER